MVNDIELRLKGFDDDQKSFVCVLMYLAGYKFTQEELAKYIQHYSGNFRETFDSMTQKQKSIAFVMIGETLGYLPKREESAKLFDLKLKVASTSSINNCKLSFEEDKE